MDQWERDYHVARIIAGSIRVGDFEIGTPSRSSRRDAGVIYRDALRQAGLEGLPSEVDALKALRDRGLWTSEDEAFIGRVASDIEEFKLNLFQNWGDPDGRAQIKCLLATAREKWAEVDGRRRANRHSTRESVAENARARFLIGASIRSRGGCPYWDDPIAKWDEPDEILDRVIEGVGEERLDEAGLRELARTEPWRSIWSSRSHATGLFDVPAIDLDDERRHLCLWSSLYDQIREHPECPREEIFEDDDALDGWLIRQRRQRDSEAKKKGVESLLSEKTGSANEVFVVPQKGVGIEDIAAMNDAQAMAVREARYEAIRQGGRLRETELPDVNMKLQMEIASIVNGNQRGT